MKTICSTLVALLLLTTSWAMELPSNKTLVDSASYLNLAVHNLAEQLLKNGDVIPHTYVIGVTTLVDLNQFNLTTPLGRLLAEMLLGELQRAGFKVREIRLTKDILMEKSHGEFSLSRETSTIFPEVDLNAILLGTYLVKGDYVFVNIRLVTRPEGYVLATAFRIIPIDSFIESLLYPFSISKTPLVRIKIRKGSP